MRLHEAGRIVKSKKALEMKKNQEISKWGDKFEKIWVLLKKVDKSKQGYID